MLSRQEFNELSTLAPQNKTKQNSINLLHLYPPLFFSIELLMVNTALFYFLLLIHHQPSYLQRFVQHHTNFFLALDQLPLPLPRSGNWSLNLCHLTQEHG